MSCASAHPDETAQFTLRCSHRWGHCAVALQENAMLVFGGAISTDNTETVNDL